MQTMFQLLESGYELGHLRDHQVIGCALPAVISCDLDLCFGTIDWGERPKVRCQEFIASVFCQVWFKAIRTLCAFSWQWVTALAACLSRVADAISTPVEPMLNIS